MHIEHRFHFDNVRVILSHLQHDQITVCNRSVALPRPVRPECNNCGFSDGRLLSVEATPRTAERPGSLVAMVLGD